MTAIQKASRLTFQSAPPVRGATTIRGSLRGDRRFQSAPPVRGATVSRKPEVVNDVVRFNPRPPCGGRHEFMVLQGITDGVSIRAPRAGGDKGAGY